MSIMFAVLHECIFCKVHLLLITCGATQRVWNCIISEVAKFNSAVTVSVPLVHALRYEITRLPYLIDIKSYLVLRPHSSGWMTRYGFNEASSSTVSALSLFFVCLNVWKGGNQRQSIKATNIWDEWHWSNSLKCNILLLKAPAIQLTSAQTTPFA